MPARQRRSRTSRISSRDANVRMTLSTRKDAQTSCETSKAPVSRWRSVAKYVCTYRVADDAEHDREDAADEDGEEVVDARAAAAQPVETLQVEPERHEDRDERQDVDVLRPGGHAFRDGDQPAVEPDRVGDDERGQPSSTSEMR